MLVQLRPRDPALADAANEASREAARHAVAMKLSNEKTRAFVRGLLAESGASAKARVTLPRVEASARRLRERFGSASCRRALERTLRDAPDPTRNGVRKELEAPRASPAGDRVDPRGEARSVGDRLEGRLAA